MKEIPKELYVKKMGDEVENDIVKLLDEGYFKSYPTETTKRALVKKLKQNHVDFILHSADEIGDEDAFNDLQILYLQVREFSDNLKEEIEDVLDQFGWYIADKEFYNDANQYVIHIEPKFPIENSNVEAFSKKVIEHYKMFYHVTFKKYEQKILKDGLTPSLSKRQEFNHPERVYLFGDKRIALDFINIHKTTKLQYAKNLAKRKNRNTGADALDKYQDKSMSEIIGFKVNLYQMMKDGKTANLYHDNRWDQSNPVFFTQNTINPKYLKKITT